VHIAYTRFVALTRFALALVVCCASVGCGGRSTQPDGSSSNDASAGGGVLGNGGAKSNGGANAKGGTSIRGGDANRAGDSSQSCEADSDCQAIQCASCRGRPSGCPNGRCVMFQCFYESCAIIDACFGKMCGDTCQACYSSDGDCVAGACDTFGDCKAVADTCEPGAPRPCAPTDAIGVGSVGGWPCNQILGWGWNGSACAPVVGCICEGSDCRSLVQHLPDCNRAFGNCH
jgi:hypothetical protein